MKRTYEIFLAHFKINTRNKTAMFFSLLFPLIFIGIFGVAFQANEPGNTTIDIALINQDAGIPANITAPFGLNSSYTMYSEEFTDILQEITYEDGSTTIFSITTYTPQEIEKAQLDVAKRVEKALLIIPEEFSTAVLATRKTIFESQVPQFPWNNYPTNTTANLTLIGDSTLVDFTITSSVIDQLLEMYYRSGMQQIIGGELDVQSNVASDSYTVFDLMAPGLIIYALLNNIGVVTSIAVIDVQSGQLNRLRLSKLKPHEYILGLISSQMLMAMIQTPIMFGATALFGFEFTISMFFSVLLFAFFVNLSISGLGIFLASFVKNSNSAGALSAIVGTPMAFLAGAFFTIPNPVLIPEGTLLGANSFRIFDILPPTTAITALRLLLVGGRTLSDLSFEIGVTVSLSIFYILIGIIAYSKQHLKPQ